MNGAENFKDHLEDVGERVLEEMPEIEGHLCIVLITSTVETSLNIRSDHSNDY